MTVKPICCGCHLEDDYGTSTVSGDGNSETPYFLEQVDPGFERPVVRVSFDDVQAIPNNADTAFSWDTEDFDSHNMWDAGAPTRLTIPIAGLYLMGLNIHWHNASSNSVRETFFRLNGSIELDRQSAFNPTAIVHSQDMQYLWFFNENDFVEAVLFQLSGGPADIIAGANPNQFWMMYMGKKV